MGKATENISTIRATVEEKQRFRKALEVFEFPNFAQFFRAAMMAYIRQIEAGETLRYPLRFERVAEPKPVKRMPGKKPSHFQK